VMVGGHQARAHVATAGIIRTIERFAAIKYFTALLTDIFQCRLHIRNCFPVDERAHQSARLERTANAHLLVSAPETLRELTGQSLVEENPARGGATLTRSANRPK